MKPQFRLIRNPVHTTRGQTCSRANNLVKSWVVLAFSSTILFSPAVRPAEPPAPLAVDKNVEQALLAENWRAVTNLLAWVTPETLSPVLRMIKGHACLALNRNNESVCLFLSASSTNDLSAWHAWTSGFATNQPGNAIRLYLWGDALARLRRMPEAVSIFSQGLSKKPNSYLLLNARGVAYAVQGKLAEARRDYERSIEASRSRFADSHANLGAYWIQRKEGAEGAVRAFSRALDVNRDFALALHGRGCAELVLKRKEAKKDLEEAIVKGDCVQELFLENLLRYAVKAGGGEPERIVAEARESGTMFQRQYSQDELGKSAANWFGTAKNLREMTYIPFNGRMADFAEHRGVERMEGMGIAGAAKWRNENPELKMTADSAVARVGMGNINMQKPERMAVAAGSGVQYGAGLAAVVGTATGVGAVPAAIMGGVALGGKAIQDVGNAALGSSKTHVDFFNDYKQSVPDFKPAPVAPIGADRGAGGVNIEMSQITWDDGSWPFRPYHGLGYALSADKVVAGTKGR